MRKKTVSLLPLFLLLFGCGYLVEPFLAPAEITWGGYFSKYNMAYDDLPIELQNEIDKDIRACSREPEDYLGTYRCMRAKGYEFYQRTPGGTCQNICLSGLLNEAEKRDSAFRRAGAWERPHWRGLDVGIARSDYGASDARIAIGYDYRF